MDEDVLIYSKTEEESTQNTKLLLDAMDKNNLRVKLPKFSFVKSST